MTLLREVAKSPLFGRYIRTSGNVIDLLRDVLDTFDWVLNTWRTNSEHEMARLVKDPTRLRKVRSDLHLLV